MCLPRLAYSIEFVRAWTDDNSHSSTTVIEEYKTRKGMRKVTEKRKGNGARRNGAKEVTEEIKKNKAKREVKKIPGLDGRKARNDRKF